jgi:hypothetical protein
MCCLCIQFTHENTSERTILHLVKNKDPPLQGMVACTAKKASYAPVFCPLSGTYYDQCQLRVSDSMFAKGPLYSFCIRQPI